MNTSYDSLSNIRLLTPPASFAAEQASQAFRAAFEPDGLANVLGLSGVAGKSVIDVGAGDGRYTGMFSRLEATSVEAVEPRSASITEGKRRGWFTGKVTCASVIDLASIEAYREGFDVATVMNLVNSSDATQILDATSTLLRPEGKLVVTLTEKWRTQDIVRHIKAKFADVNYSKVWVGQPQPANNIIIVGSKKLV